MTALEQLQANLQQEASRREQTAQKNNLAANQAENQRKQWQNRAHELTISIIEPALKEFEKISSDGFAIHYTPIKSSELTKDKSILMGGMLEIWFSKGRDGLKAKTKAVLRIVTGAAGYEFEARGFPTEISNHHFDDDQNAETEYYIRPNKIPLEQISKAKVDEFAKHLIGQHQSDF